MKPYLSFVNSKLDKLKNENLYRKLRSVKVNEAIITINKKQLINFCSNDYLGIKPINQTIKQFESSSRLLSGNDKSYQTLEKKLAKHKSQSASLVYPTGYMANLGIISSISQKGDQIVSDELNHASIIEACKLSKAKLTVYKHNDISDIEKKVKRVKGRKFIITEGIFSMDGDFANLREITQIAHKENAVLILDDAHGDFTVGFDGKGSPDHWKVSKQIDVYVSSLSKGLGSFGGYIASQKNIIELLINKSKPFIYTSALPSSFIEHATKRFDSNREKQRKKLETNVTYFVKGLKKMGYEINSTSHIIPIIIGDEKNTIEYGKFLMSHGVFSQPIRYPTVAKAKARVRLSITAWLSKKHLDHSFGAFELAGKKFGII